MNTENFDKLPEEKRRTVLNAAFTCFGKDGYKKTAMSEIAAAAGVSKAALFHYFGTKKDLYLYLFRFSCEEILAKMETGTEDFFECIAIGTRIKMEVMEKHPGMFDFLFSLMREEDTALLADVRKINEHGVAQGIGQLFSRVDWGRLLPEISKEEAYNLVNWVNEGYIKTFAGKLDESQLITGLNRYLGIIKKATYKEDYL